MITFFLLLILLVIMFLLGFKKYKATWFFLILFALLFIGNGTGLIGSYLLTQLQTPYLSDEDPNWKESNIIILLGAGTIKQDAEHIKPGLFAYSRILKAAQLYFSCRKRSNHCQILVSGGDVFNVGSSEAEIYRRTLMLQNVPEEDIIMEKESKNTYQNAEFTADILKDKQYKQLILVTSGFHLKRALLYFSNFNLFPEAVPADYLSTYPSFKALGYNLALADIALKEYEGILRFYIFNRMGWNKKPT